MRHGVLIVLCIAGCVGAQQPQATDAARVAEILRKSDPVHNGNGAAELFAPDAPLDAAIRATAQSATAERVVRLRAVRLDRLLDLAQRVRSGGLQRSVGWWLALDEIDRELPAALRLPLLARTDLEPAELAAAQRELTVARDCALRFCLEWNETRWSEPLDDEHRKVNASYDALEAALKKCGFAAAPALFEILAVPPEGSFSQLEEKNGISARQQVRAILALAAILRLRRPFRTSSCTAQARA